MAEDIIGMVEDFFAHPVVAGIKLTGSLFVGVFLGLFGWGLGWGGVGE